MSDVPAELQDAQARFARPDALTFISGAREPRGTRRAAVLILLGQGGAGYDLVLVEKRADLRSQAGQIAFPGGRIESVDVDPVAAADGTLYRVRVGPEALRANAEKLRDALKSRFKLDGLVVTQP